MNIGQTIRDIRKEKGITQLELSERCGLLQGYISRVEKGRRVPMLTNLVVIAKALGMPLSKVIKRAEQAS